MALTAETGAGVYGADSYAAQATIDAYWTARPHDALATTWADADSTDKDGAAREASAYVDAIYGPQYRGTRKGYIQGLEWPRVNTMVDDGLPLPDLPPQLVSAVCELAARALSANLMTDATTSGAVKRTRSKVGPIEEEVEYDGAAPITERYGFVDQLLRPILRVELQWEWK